MLLYETLLPGLAGGCVQHLFVSLPLPLQHAHPCEALSTHVRVAHTNCCMGKGAQRGRGFAPLGSPLPMPELIPLLLPLHSTADMDSPCELDANSFGNFKPQTKSVLCEAGCATSDYFTLAMCRERVPVDGLTPLAGYLLSMLPWGLLAYCL